MKHKQCVLYFVAHLRIQVKRESGLFALIELARSSVRLMLEP